MNAGAVNSSVVQSPSVLIGRTVQCSLKTASNRCGVGGWAWMGVVRQNNRSADGVVYNVVANDCWFARLTHTHTLVYTQRSSQFRGSASSPAAPAPGPVCNMGRRGGGRTAGRRPALHDHAKWYLRERRDAILVLLQHGPHKDETGSLECARTCSASLASATKIGSQRSSRVGQKILTGI